MIKRETVTEAMYNAIRLGATKMPPDIRAALQRALAEETDSIFFLTTNEYKLKIMEAIRDSAGLKTDGSAVIFSLPVDDLVGIGRFDGETGED